MRNTIGSRWMDMLKNKFRLVKTFKILIIALFALSTLILSNNLEHASAYQKTNKTMNQQSNIQSFDVNVSINYKISITPNLKGVNPNIIKAARQGLFDWDCDNAKYFHYNGYSKNEEILIFDVVKINDISWGVHFWVKEKGEKDFSRNKNEYSAARVDKQKDGSYKGYVFSSKPAQRVGETY